MGAWGAIIMSFFGAVFAAMTLGLELHAPAAPLLLPFLVFAAIALWGALVIRRPGRGVSPSERGRRAIVWSSIAEGVGLFIAANVVVNVGHPELLLPAMALVVGLHFFPMAYAVPFRPFYALGAALIAAAALGFVLRRPAAGELSGFAAAAALWIASLLAVRRDARARSLSSTLESAAHDAR